MNNSAGGAPRTGSWPVFAAVSLAFFLLNLSTFTSLGVVLYTMVAELHWSLTAAGLCFTVLGLACGLSSPLPALSMRWLGGRVTLCGGCLLLVVGFTIASVAQSMYAFYAAMLFLGLGYALAGNVPGVYLLAGWFKGRTSRVIGLYLMLGALGAAFGPPIVEFIVSVGGWRTHWRIMALAAALTGVVCLLFVRDAEPAATQVGARAAGQVPSDAGAAGFDAGAGAGAEAGAWSARRALFTWQFVLVTAALTMTTACVTTYSSVMVTHLVKRGATPAGAALVLGAMAITATFIKGGAGRLCESVHSSTVLGAGLLMQALGSAVLAHAATPLVQYAGALTFGAGWGFAYVAGTVALLDYFGGTVGAKILSVVWLLCSAAAAGPPAAGMIADNFGTFAPIFHIYAGILVVLSLPIFIMSAPAHGRDVPGTGTPLSGEPQI